VNGRHCPLGKAHNTWKRLQSGQEKLIRFGRYVEIFGDGIRHQTGHEHRCSVGFIFDLKMVKMRPYCKLDELLLTRCIAHHDEPEGILIRDVPANIKTSKDDLKEYLTFQKLYKALGKEFWKEMQRSFLLQFCLDNPSCFPEDARAIMEELSLTRRNEALFFDGVQRYDYLHYAYECFDKRGITKILADVAENQIERMDEIACELPGFDMVVWTPERRAFFRDFIAQHTIVELKKSG
jgi:hypothetical protein